MSGAEHDRRCVFGILQREDTDQPGCNMIGRVLRASIGRTPPGQDVKCNRFAAIIRADPGLMHLLTCLRTLDLPQWRLVAGCLYQTVWNALTDRPRGAGIKDYDVIYFDADDLSWEAEDAVIRRVAAATQDCVGPVQVRNQSRVHLWFASRFGCNYPQLSCADELSCYLRLARARCREFDWQRMIVWTLSRHSAWTTSLRCGSGPNCALDMRVTYRQGREGKGRLATGCDRAMVTQSLIARVRGYNTGQIPLGQTCRIGYFITHPEVTIDPGVPVPDWSLSPAGVQRMHRVLEQRWLSRVRSIFSSCERKARDAAAILADHLRLSPVTINGLGENDR